MVPVQKINNQMKEMREKGLCYYYGSKWNPWHKCKNPKLFLIEEVIENEECEEEGQAKKGKEVIEFSTIQKI